jgi:polar amino acid transport system ATP-binding protein
MTAPAAPIIELRQVGKRFGDLTVLDRLDLAVAADEHVGLIGPSGSGKSTLLRVLMTLEEIQEGEVLVDGAALWRATPAGSVRAPEDQVRAIRGKLGMVFQSFNLFPHLTALQNVALAPQRVLRMAPDAATARALELLEMVGLKDKAQQYPLQLSGGQQQRVAIARALAMRPQILLFDEVTSALDPETVGEVLGVIRRLAREFRFTILMVTHQMDIVREISDRVLFFDRGRILESGPPEQLFTQPRHDRTRLFLQAIREAR